ncbi:nucleoside-diphosphate sugar epimerase, partial [Acinetobacter baumannii]
MTISTKKAIVVGATGLVGLALVEQLEQTPEFEAIT